MMNRKKTYQCLLVLLNLSFVLTARFMSAQTAGTLDPTFGNGGKVTTSFGGRGDEGHSVVMQRDGKLVVAGSTTKLDETTDFALVRYNSNGTRDRTFGTGGKVTTSFGDFDFVGALVLQSEGKIVAAGVTIVNASPNFAVARYNSNGTLDPSFGTGGKVITGFGGDAQAFATAAQADGKVVVAGYAHINGGFNFALARYNSNGTLDGSFGAGGRKTIPFGPVSVAQANALAIQRDGKIVVAGASNITTAPDFALARLNTDGSLDTTFGNGGQVVTNFGGVDEAFAVALQTDGKIVAAGVTGSDFALARYSSNGTLDATFGSSGTVTTDFAGSNDVVLGVAIRSDGKIVAAGRAFVSARIDFAVARYNNDGTLDSGFGVGGKTTTHFAGGSTDQASSVAIQPDGKTVVAGTAFVNANNRFALARYQ